MIGSDRSARQLVQPSIARDGAGHEAAGGKYIDTSQMVDWFETPQVYDRNSIEKCGRSHENFGLISSEVSTQTYLWRS